MNPMRFNLRLLILAVAAGFIAGCASETASRGPAPRDTFTKGFNRVADGGAEIDAAQLALVDLVGNPQPDLRYQFQSYVNALNSLSTTSADVVSENRVLKMQGRGYFNVWDREIAAIQDPDLRRINQTRRDEVARRFERISQQYGETESAFLPYMADLRAVQTVIAGNPANGGRSGVHDLAAKATADSVPLKASLARLIADVDDGGDPLQH
jgi:hypothetical protein